MSKCERCGQEASLVARVDGAGLARGYAPHPRLDGKGQCSGLVSVRRWDTGELSAPERLANGWIRVQGRIARTGIQEYAGPGGKMVRELRLPEEVFDEASVASFNGVPLTNTHPPVLLDDKNAKFYSVGSVSNVRREGDWLMAELLITEAEARRDAENGRSELSNGYECDLDPTQIPELVAKWGPYDSIQRIVRGNHCALVDEARAGHEARARMDAGENLMVASGSPRQGARTMPPQIRIDGLTLELNDGNAVAIQTAIDKLLSSSTTEREALTKKLDAAVLKSGRAFGLFDSLYDVLKRGKKRRDAMKARMMGCDECGGSGEVEKDGEQAKCDYCDGKGQVRMHDKIADLVEPEAQEHGEAGGDPTDDDDDMDDADELATERETEESGAAAEGKAKGKKDAIDQRRRARRDARKDSAGKKVAAAKKARQDSIARRIERAARSRAKLEATAMALCGEGFKCDGKTDLELRKAVIVKAWPEVKLDGKAAEYIAARFDIAVEELQAAPGAADRVRALAGGGGGGRTDGGGSLDPDKARQAMIKANENAHALKGAGK